MIPDDTDILVTHGPSFGINDKLDPIFSKSEENIGCKDLADAIDRVKPKLFACGHIHEAYGKVEKDGTIYINASCLNENYKPVNLPHFLVL